MEQSLTPEQIKNWRKIIYMQLEQKMKGAGAYAIIMPESEVIAFWKRMKGILEQPGAQTSPFKRKRRKKEPCKHDNSFTGNMGKYCIDCEKYV